WVVRLAPEHEAALQPLYGKVKCDTHGREADQRREHAGRVEVEIHLQDQIANPLTGADELADDRTGDAEYERDIKAREDERQRVWKQDVAHDLPAGRTERAHERELLALHR